MKKLIIGLLVLLLVICILYFHINATPLSIEMESVSYGQTPVVEFQGNVIESAVEDSTICLKPAHYETLNNENVLIMGNSLSVGLSYVDENQYYFIAKGSATLKSTRQEGRYDQIKDYDFDTVIINFGTNALYWTLDTWRYELGLLFEEIYKVNPDADIVIATPPPVSQKINDESTTLTNKNVKRCADYLYQIAVENGVYYLDNSKFFGDVMPSGASGDGIHLNSKWYKMWLEFMIEEVGNMEKLVFDDV